MKIEKEENKKKAPMLLCLQNDSPNTIELFTANERYYLLTNMEDVEEIDENKAIEVYADKKSKFINKIPPGEFFPSLKVIPSHGVSYECSTENIAFIFEIKNDTAQIHSVNNLKSKVKIKSKLKL